MSQTDASPTGVAPASPPAPGFVHLHVHTEYSTLDGACKIGPLLDRCQELGMDAIAITDHGVLYGAVEFYLEAKKRGIKPIIGLEAYVVDDVSVKKEMRWHHLTLLAKDSTGYRNLVQLASRGFMEGFYYKPRVDKAMLRQHSDGIIALTGCLGGEIPSLLRQGDLEGAIAAAAEFKDIFGDENVYVEVQDNGYAEQKEIIPRLKEVAAAIGRPLVATNDTHFLNREDFESYKALLCLQTGSTLDDPGMKMESGGACLRSPAEMAQLFPESELSGALTATLEIAERCQVEMGFGRLLIPGFSVPDDGDENVYLRKLCEEGLNRRYDGDVAPVVRERLEFELKTIAEMGFASYFLIVWDFVRYAKDNDIPVGPGRGSAAGSLVAYCLGITQVDPLKYDLLFERFLNPGRKSMPDIDIDFSPEKREKVLEYVAGRYGRNSVAQIITFGTMAARQATKDAGRVLGFPYGDVEAIVKFIPEGSGVKLQDCMKPGQELRQAYDSDPDAKKIIDLALYLEGLVRQDGIHAAGVVISDRPLTEYIPLQQKGPDAEVVTQYAMKYVEKLGLLKMDFLGVRNLDILDTAVKLVRDSRGVDIDLLGLPLDDAKTYAMMQRGESDGVFQFESDGMKDALKLVKPTAFEDLIALMALFRPGPMQFISDYARVKRDPESVQYDDPRLEAILKPTNGVAIYQEQLMEIARVMASFTLAEADDLRKAISKKDPALLATLKDKFIGGCVANQASPQLAEKLWGLMDAAKDYSFNKSHAVAYALVAYQTAYMKANYPVEYMAATISSVMDTKDKVPFYVDACVRMGIEVLPPDVSESGAGFRVVEERIRFGLKAVKNVGTNVIRSIIETREKDGPFKSIFDFCRRVDSRLLNRKALESLIRCGALDSTGASRKGMLEVMEQAQAMGSQSQQDSLAGQGSFFDVLDDGAGKQSADPPVAAAEFGNEELMRLERETLGLFLSSHPLIGLDAEMARRGAISIEALAEARDGDKVTTLGMISRVKKLTTKKGDPMAFVNLTGLDKSVELVVFTRIYEKCRELLTDDRVVLVSGRVDRKGSEEVKMVADAVKELDLGTVERGPREALSEPVADDAPTAPAPDLPVMAEAHEPRPQAGPLPDEPADELQSPPAPEVSPAQMKLELTMNLDQEEIAPELVGSMKDLCRSYPGAVPIILNLHTTGGVRCLKLGSDYRVEPAEGLLEVLEGLPGVREVSLAARES